VADFGLARHATGSSSPPSPSESSTELDPTLGSGAGASASASGAAPTQLTRTGRVAGTPAYMAPEQLLAGEVDARADQFGFCVALYEGLYGRRPFTGRTLGALAVSHTAGPSPPPLRSAVPRRVWRVLSRGLAERAEDRFESMEALLRALDPARARRRRMLALGLALGVPAVAAGIALRPDAGPRCEIDASALAEAWDGERRERVRSAFLATGLSFAGQAFHGVDAELAQWSGAWLDARRAACEATHVEGTQSPERLDARMACLERKRRDVAARTLVLAEADASVVGRSDRVLARLPDVEACADPGVLEPSDPEQARAIEAARDGLARATALVEAGELERAEALSIGLRPEAEALGHPSLLLEVEALGAELLLARDALDRGVPALLAVARRAEALRLDELTATARVRLAHSACGRWSRPEQERWLLAEAEAAVDRVGRPGDPRRVELELARGSLAIAQGDYDEAVEIHRRGVAATHERGHERWAEAHRNGLMVALQRRGDHERARAEGMAALSLARDRYGARSPVVGDRHFNLGLLALEEGRLEEAQEHIELAHAIHAEAFGRESIDAARARFAGLKLSMRRGELDAARHELELLLPSYERELGPQHVETAQVLNAQGVLLYFAGEHAAAIDAYRRALAIQRRALGPDHEEIGLLLSNIGESLLGVGEPEQALASFDEALEIMRGALPEGHRLLALPGKGRGLALLVLGRHDEAVSALERALAIHDIGSGEPIEHAETRFALARALRPRDAARAAVLAEQARDDFDRLGLDDRREALDQWLAEPNATKEQSTP
jgi:tetratricopeptide (TPR) repeat protein